MTNHLTNRTTRVKPTKWNARPRKGQEGGKAFVSTGKKPGCFAQGWATSAIGFPISWGFRPRRAASWSLAPVVLVVFFVVIVEPPPNPLLTHHAFPNHYTTDQCVEYAELVFLLPTSLPLCRLSVYLLCSAGEVEKKHTRWQHVALCDPTTGSVNRITPRAASLTGIHPRYPSLQTLNKNWRRH